LYPLAGAGMGFSKDSVGSAAGFATGFFFFNQGLGTSLFFSAGLAISSDLPDSGVRELFDFKSTLVTSVSLDSLGSVVASNEPPTAVLVSNGLS